MDKKIKASAGFDPAFYVNKRFEPAVFCLPSKRFTRLSYDASKSRHAWNIFSKRLTSARKAMLGLKSCVGAQPACLIIVQVICFYQASRRIAP